MAEHEHAHDPLDPAHLMGHVKDATYFELPKVLGGKLELGQLETGVSIQPQTGVALIDDHLEKFDLKLTKFMVLEVVAALLVIALFSWLAQRVSGGQAPKGRLTNFLESMVVYIRDQVARPAIGHHHADHFVPFLLTLFFFVLGLNLLGMVPWAGSATGALATTGTLALITFGTVVFSGMAELGPIHFWQAQVPHMDLPLPLAIMLKPMIFVIEVMGLLIKHFILAMRLLANMFAGHLVLAVILAFIAATATSGYALWLGVTVSSVLGATALSMLELFVAFLQAYIFTFLSALFIGSAVHPH
jgi:F-type H+-transporting ATPase subunit a